MSADSLAIHAALPTTQCAVPIVYSRRRTMLRFGAVG